MRPVQPSLTLEIWGSGNGPTTQESLAQEPNQPYQLAYRRGVQGLHTGHIALSLTRTSDASSSASPSTASSSSTTQQKPLDRTMFMNRDLQKMQKVRFSFNPDATTTQILRTRIAGSVSAFCASFADDCGYEIGDDYTKRIAAAYAEDAGPLYKQVEDYANHGRAVMQKILGLTGAALFGSSSGGSQKSIDEVCELLAAQLTELVDTIVLTQDDDPMNLIRSVRAELVKDMTEGVFASLQSVSSTEAFCIDFNNLEAWWAQNKDRPEVRKFFNEQVFRPIFDCMQTLVKNSLENSQFASSTVRSIAETSYADRTPHEVDLNFLQAYLDMDELETKMQTALERGYSTKYNTCIQATLNIIVQAIYEKQDPAGMALLANMKEKGLIRDRSKGPGYKVAEGRINTPRDAFEFTQQLAQAHQLIQDARHESKASTPQPKQ